jgi:taurine dioxygenase
MLNRAVAAEANIGLANVMPEPQPQVQHKANFDYELPLRRLMYRTTVRGTAPF